MKLPPSVKKKSEKSHFKSFKNSEHFNIAYRAVALFFIGSFFSVFYAFKTMISILDIIKIIVLMGAIAYILQLIFFKTIFLMKKMEQLSFTIFGATPVLFALFMILNFYISTESEFVIDKITNVHYNFGEVSFKTNALPCNDYPELCNVRSEDRRLRNGAQVKFEISKGLFGFLVLKNVEYYP